MTEDKLWICDNCEANCCKLLEISLSKEEYLQLIKIKLDLKIKQNIIEYIIEPPCPFLNSLNKCSIYENRPILCRCYPIRIGMHDVINRVTLNTHYCNRKINYDENLTRSQLFQMLPFILLDLWHDEQVIKDFVQCNLKDRNKWLINKKKKTQKILKEDEKGIFVRGFDFPLNLLKMYIEMVKKLTLKEIIETTDNMQNLTRFLGKYLV